MTALIEVLDSLKLPVDQKQYSVATFIDLWKASDIINHCIPLARLTKYGFGEVEANWICSYLTDRQQYVVFNGVHSQLCLYVISLSLKVLHSDSRCFVCFSMQQYTASFLLVHLFMWTMLKPIVCIQTLV